MKIVESYVDILEQKPGIKGMFKHVEVVGRLSHKTEDSITEDSYMSFVDLIKKWGHWSVFDLGTVYLSIPSSEKSENAFKILNSPWTRFNIIENNGVPERYLVTTNYRVIAQNGLEQFMLNHWCDPTENFYHRITSHFVCSRPIANEFTRHAAFRPIQESTRFCNYSKGKFNNEITFILPEWVYKCKEYYLPSHPELKKLSGVKLWNALIDISDIVKSRNEEWKLSETNYLKDLKGDESGFKLVPGDARGGLSHDLKTEFYMCGFVDDYIKEPDHEKTTEKYGFFHLRTALDTHPDARKLACELKNQFIKNGYDKLK